MYRTFFIIGVVLCFALTAIAVSQRNGQHVTAVSPLHAQALVAAEPIPAIPSEPSVTPPQWVLYVGSILCLLIGVIMLWRCHAAGSCVIMRRLNHSHQPPARH